MVTTKEKNPTQIGETSKFCMYISCKNPGPSKNGYFEDPKTPPAIPVQTFPLEGPRILRVENPGSMLGDLMSDS